VFNLDEKLRVADESASLGILLMHAASSHQGSPLQTYLYSESDKARFEQHLLFQPDGDMIDPLILQMRDSSGLPVSVELLFVRLDELYIHASYMIGIRELNDTLSEDPQVNELQDHIRFSSETDESPGAVGRRGHAGTPARVAPRVLLEAEDTNSESSDSTTLQGLPVDPMVARFNITDYESRKRSMHKLLLKWNVEATSFCCSHHQLVHAAQKILQGFKRGACSDSKQYIDDYSTQQCGHCGMIEDSMILNSKKSCPWCLQDHFLMTL